MGCCQMTSKMLDDLPGLQDGGQVKLLTLRQCLNVKIPTQEDGGRFPWVAWNIHKRILLVTDGLK